MSKHGAGGHATALVQGVLAALLECGRVELCLYPHPPGALFADGARGFSRGP